MISRRLGTAIFLLGVFSANAPTADFPSLESTQGGAMTPRRAAAGCRCDAGPAGPACQRDCATTCSAALATRWSPVFWEGSSCDHLSDWCPCTSSPCSCVALEARKCEPAQSQESERRTSRAGTSTKKQAAGQDERCLGYSVKPHQCTDASLSQPMSDCIDVSGSSSVVLQGGMENGRVGWARSRPHRHRCSIDAFRLGRAGGLDRGAAGRRRAH